MKSSRKALRTSTRSRSTSRARTLSKVPASCSPLAAALRLTPAWTPGTTSAETRAFSCGCTISTVWNSKRAKLHGGRQPSPSSASGRPTACRPPAQSLASSPKSCSRRRRTSASLAPMEPPSTRTSASFRPARRSGRSPSTAIGRRGRTELHPQRSHARRQSKTSKSWPAAAALLSMPVESWRSVKPAHGRSRVAHAVQMMYLQ